MSKLVEPPRCFRCKGHGYVVRPAAEAPDVATVTACDCRIGDAWAQAQVDFLRSHGVNLKDVNTAVNVVTKLRAFAERIRAPWKKGG